MPQNRDLPAQPTTACIDRKTKPVVEQQTGNDEYAFTGLTKREYFAGQAMAGLCNAHNQDGTWTHDARDVSEAAVRYADALLAELDK